MKLALKLAALAVVSATALTGCTSPNTSAENSEVKEAGLRGSRICLVNASSVPMSAGVVGTVVPENSKLIVGTSGELSNTKELCFAGWNSINTHSLFSNDQPSGGGELKSTDIAVGVNIDGEYDAIKFRAFNTVLYPPVLWWVELGKESANWGGGSFDDSQSKDGSVGGHKFSVTRRDDSDNYKEFLIRFSE